MSASIDQVISAAGYDLSTPEDAQWLISQVNRFEELVEEAEGMLEAVEEAETERLEQEYRSKFN